MAYSSVTFGGFATTGQTSSIFYFSLDAHCMIHLGIQRFTLYFYFLLIAEREHTGLYLFPVLYSLVLQLLHFMGSKEAIA